MAFDARISGPFLRRAELKIKSVSEKFYTLAYLAIMRPLFNKVGNGNRINPRASFDNYGVITIGNNNRICRNVVIWPSKLLIGSDNAIGPGTCVFGDVIIGDNVLIGPNCMITGGGHGTKLNGTLIRLQESLPKGIAISSDVWIGANAVILDGVSVSEGTVIGAGSVVTKSTERNGVYCGNPAKLIKFR